MVIWLRSSGGGVGIGQDVLRASDIGELATLDGASERCRRQIEDMLADAEREADALRHAAREDAARTIEAARAEYEAAERLGYEAGQARALEEAQETMLDGAASVHDQLLALRERIADLVLRTVARTLGDADRGVLFAQIGANLSRHLDEASFLTVRVAPGDVEAATRAFRAVSDTHRWPLNPTVSADPDAEAGSCVCEWDHGIVTGGLPLQLSALERAIGALESAGVPSGDDDAGDDDAYEDENEDEDEDGDDEDGDGDDVYDDEAAGDWSMP